MKKTKNAYAAAGVDIDAQERGLEEVKRLARSTFTDGVLSDVGLFGGLFRPDLGGMSEPVLVASADGVGTKLAVARQAGDYSTVGRDLVNHCVNDILVQGAAPLFFLDYVGSGVLEPERLAELVRGEAVLLPAPGIVSSPDAVPILRREDPEFRAKYDENLKPLPYEVKMSCMMEPIDMPVTRRMSKDAKTEYLDEMARHWSAQGVRLTDPEAVKWSAA